jgi:nucleotidyltransferase/DNA polymerase involved in DNA repair
MILYIRFAPEALPLGLIEDLTPVFQVFPPDAALVDVRGAERYFGRSAPEIAALLRVRALAHHGLDCTIGVGPNPLLARMAARETRPGTTLVAADAAAFLADRPATALYGVGPKLAHTLCSYGLDSIGRIAGAPPTTLQRIVGARAGRELQERARGIDRTQVIPNAAARSIAAERAFPLDELDRERHRRALLSLTGELGARMRDGGQVCRSLTLTVRYADRSTTTRSRTLREPTAHSAALTATAYAVHASLGLQRARVRGIGLRAEGLTPVEHSAHQLTFDPADDKARRIEEVADRARARFGPRAVVPGALAGRVRRPPVYRRQSPS